MRTIYYFRNYILVLFAALFTFVACSDEVERPPYLDPNGGDESDKEFVVYEWLSYKNKPDLSSERMSKILLVYEAALTKENPSNGNAYTLLDVEKVKYQAKAAKMQGYKIISTDIESWYGKVSGEKIKEDLNTTFNIFKQEVPDAKLGNYGVPFTNLNVRRYNRKATEEEIITEWKKASESRTLAGSVSDYVCPSFYIAEPNFEQWKKDLLTSVKYSKELYPDKKIVAYIWPQYYDFKDSPHYKKFIDQKIWASILEACFENLDGVIIWSGAVDENENPVDWQDQRVQDFMETTRKFISKHAANIKVVGTETEELETKEPTTFHMYQSFNFTSTPIDLSVYGLQPIRIVDEKVLSTGSQNDILTPDAAKISTVATDALNNPKMPVIITNNTWIRDRTSDNNAMLQRFRSVNETFKTTNKQTQLGFYGVGPTSMSGQRFNENTTEYQIYDSWYRYAAEPMRGLREFADILVPATFLIDDNLEVWKADCTKILSEAKINNPKKPIYAYLWTNYFNKKDAFPFFADAYKPIKEETWLAALEYLYLRCDGVVIVGNVQKDDPVAWSENLGLMKATKTFYERHKTIIDKTLTSPVKPAANLLTNGGFENSVEPHSLDPKIHNKILPRPLRLAGHFDEIAKATQPVSDGKTTIGDGVWYHRCKSEAWYWLTYVDMESVTSVMPNAGQNSLALYQPAAPKDKVVNSEFVQCLGQRVSLDNTKKYKFEFYVQKGAQSWAQDNFAKQISVGVVSSTNAVVTTDYTYYKTLDLPDNNSWTKCTVIFDLPAIIAENPGKSFEKSAVFIGLVPVVKEDGTSMKAQVNLDDISLTEIK